MRAGRDVRLPQARLRRSHERLVFRHIRAHAPIPRSRLAEQTGLSAQAVGAIVRDLLDDALVVETEMPRGDGPGASPIGLRVRGDGAFALGFGIERDRLSGVVLDLSGSVRWRASAELPAGEPATTTLARMRTWTFSALESKKWTDNGGRFCGIGVAAPGPIDLASGTILGPPNFPSWEKVDLVSALGPPLGYRSSSTTQPPPLPSASNGECRALMARSSTATGG